MGTRNLTAVMVDGEYKIAQYGQWDGHLQTQGMTALGFLRTANLNAFKKQCRRVTFLTKDEIEELNVEFGKIGDTRFYAKYPELSRDRGAGILECVMKGASKLQNSISFAGDSLFCEYGYVVDLDSMKFEVYRGFNKTPITEGRFKSGDPALEKADGYEPIRLLATFDLNALPTDEVFLACDASESEATT